MTTIELVRHATAHSRDQWWGRADRERPLNDEGHSESAALARDLRQGEPIVALVSSPSTRCVQTLEPLGRVLGQSIAHDEALAETPTMPVLDGGDAWVASAWMGGRAIALVDRLVAAHPHGRVVVCSHGDVIPALMAVLAGRDELDLTDVRCPKGGRFTLAFDGTRCVEAVAKAPPQD